MEAVEIEAQRQYGKVEVVDKSGNFLYSALVSETHSGDGLLHRAFSIFLFSRDESKILMQKRSSTKMRWALMWSNACCGHPSSYETLIDDAQCRLEEELGIRVEKLKEVGVFTYKAYGLENYLEWEYDHVLIGYFNEDEDVPYSRNECDDVSWVPVDEVLAITTLTPWFERAYQIAVQHMQDS